VHQIRVPWGAYIASSDSRADLRGPTSKGRKGGKVDERKGRSWVRRGKRKRKTDNPVSGIENFIIPESRDPISGLGLQIGRYFGIVS